MSTEQVQERFIKEHWTAESGITAVGIGSHDGQPCLRVSVLDESSKTKIPDQYDGLAVIITVAGEPRPLSTA